MSRPVLLAVLLTPVLAAGQEHAPADLAVRARAVLAKHCLTCHGDQPGRSSVKVLDHAAMTGRDRPIPFFGREAALALDLIKEGSMPPGSLPKVPAADISILEDWLKNGSARYPGQFNDEFVHRAILGDVGNLGPQETADARYLSLHHVAATAPDDLGTARREFLAALKGVMKPDAPILWVDATATICRIDLAKSGWDYRPFFKLDDLGKEKKGEPVTASVFDLVLLEYPHAVIPPESATFSALAKRFLVPADQVRPIPFVRGDWFIATVMDSGVTKDLRTLIKRRWSTLPPGLDPQKAGKPPAVRAAPSPDKGTPLPALDAWYAAQDPPDPGKVTGFTAETLDPVSEKQKAKFKPGESFKVRIAGGPPAHAQYVYVELGGKVEDKTAVEDVGATGKVDGPIVPNGGFAAAFGTESIRVFAALHKFPDGNKWRVRDAEIERFVHPFFKVDPASGKVDLTDAGISRKTLTIEVVK
jgi:mono/diheme cytochrome c family protein